MKVKELKEIVDKCCERGDECDVEFWINLDDGFPLLAELVSIGQFSCIPDMTITVKPSNNECKIYTTTITDEKQFDYRNLYNKLRKQIDNFYNSIN